MKCVDPEPAAKTVARAVPDPVTDPAAVLAPVPAPAPVSIDYVDEAVEPELSVPVLASV